MLCLLFLAQFWLIVASPWPGPSPTISVGYVEDAIAITPTLAPTINLELLRRATSSKSTTNWSGWGVEVCGWVDGDYSSIFSCYQTDTCLWNSRNSVVGCGNTAVIPHITACVDYNTTSCDGPCSANPNILKCGSINDNCYTIKFPNNYTMPTCGYSRNMSRTVDTTYGGLPTPVFLPRYLGLDNILTVETQFPEGQRPSPTSGPAGKTLQSGSPSPEGEVKKKKKSLVGPIVGGVLGGIFLVAAIAMGVWLFLRQKEKGQLDTSGEQKVGGLGGVRTEPNVVPYELGGKPKTAYEIG